MIRYIAAAVVGFLYLAGSVWMVQTAGRVHRNGLIKPRVAARETEKSTLALPKKADRKAPGVSISEGSSPNPAPVPPAPAQANAETSIKSIGVHGSSAKRPMELAKLPASTPPAAKQALGQLQVVPNVTANPLAQNPFWNQEFLTKSWDLSALTTDEEHRLGTGFHDLIVQLNLLVTEGPWLSRVEDAAEPILKTIHRKDIHYKFFIINSDDVNAFSAPGGYIYISRGLFDLIGEDEDYALQFVVGHEMAHVDLRHAITCLQDLDVRNLPMGTLQKLYWLILPAGYLASDEVDQEFKADEWVADRMRRFQSTRREILIFLNKLEGYAKTHRFEGGRAKPQSDRDLSMLDNHYRAQTAVRKRLKHLKAFIDEPADPRK